MAEKKKAAPKKTTPKKTTAKKTTTKKAAVKKAALKKATAKKLAPKKTAVKKTTPKQTTAKKTAGDVREKILVSLDATESSQKAIDYLIKMGPVLKSCQMTLCHVLPHIPPDMLEDGGSENPDIERALKAERDEDISEWEEKLKSETIKVFESYKKQLVDSGIPSANIKTKVIGRTMDIGKSIVNAANKGGFTTIVLGRRGVSFLQELALESVSYRVLKLAKNCTVWVVH